MFTKMLQKSSSVFGVSRLVFFAGDKPEEKWVDREGKSSEHAIKQAKKFSQRVTYNGEVYFTERAALKEEVAKRIPDRKDLNLNPIQVGNDEKSLKKYNGQGFLYFLQQELPQAKLNGTNLQVAYAYMVNQDPNNAYKVNFMRSGMKVGDTISVVNGNMTVKRADSTSFSVDIYPWEKEKAEEPAAEEVEGKPKQSTSEIKAEIERRLAAIKEADLAVREAETQFGQAELALRILEQDENGIDFEVLQNKYLKENAKVEDMNAFLLGTANRIDAFAEKAEDVDTEFASLREKMRIAKQKLEEATIMANGDEKLIPISNRLIKLERELGPKAKPFQEPKEKAAEWKAFVKELKEKIAKEDKTPVQPSKGAVSAPAKAEVVPVRPVETATKTPAKAADDPYVNEEARIAAKEAAEEAAARAAEAEKADRAAWDDAIATVLEKSFEQKQVKTLEDLKDNLLAVPGFKLKIESYTPSIPGQEKSLLTSEAYRVTVEKSPVDDSSYGNLELDVKFDTYEGGSYQMGNIKSNNPAEFLKEAVYKAHRDKLRATK